MDYEEALGGGPANSVLRNHAPGKTFRVGGAKQESVNHSEPNVTSKGNNGPRVAGLRSLADRRADKQG
jgi:hypothetical protein